MKTVDWIFTPAHYHQMGYVKFLYQTPLLSVRSPDNFSPRKLRWRFLAYFSLLIIFILIAREWLAPLNYFKVMLISPMVLWLTECLSLFGQFYARVISGKHIIPMHNKPLLASNLSQFWGKRWNLWVQDWLRDLSRISIRKPSWVRILFIFCISGIFHEEMVNLPYSLYIRENFFGSMMGYFVIQGIGLWIDKKLMVRFPGYVQRIFLWIWVIVPSPLFLNRPFLEFFGILHE